MPFWNLPDVTADSGEPTGFPACAYPSPIRSSRYISLHETLIRHTVQYLWKLNLLREGWTLLGLNRHIQSEINSWPKFVKTNTSIIALMMLDSFDLRKITQSIVTSLKYLKISVVVTVFFSLLNFACWLGPHVHIVFFFIRSLRSLVMSEICSMKLMRYCTNHRFVVFLPHPQVVACLLLSGLCKVNLETFAVATCPINGNSGSCKCHFVGFSHRFHSTFQKCLLCLHHGPQLLDLLSPMLTAMAATLIP